jgi:anti-anti-sigma regulatory factor
MRLGMDRIGEMAVIECQGKIVRSPAAFRLRDAVTSQGQARIIVLDLTEVHALGAEGLDVLMFLQRWAAVHAIELKLFNPSRFVWHRLDNARASSNFEIASLHDMMALLAHSEIPLPFKERISSATGKQN